MILMDSLTCSLVGLGLRPRRWRGRTAAPPTTTYWESAIERESEARPNGRALYEAAKPPSPTSEQSQQVRRAKRVLQTKRVLFVSQSEHRIDS